jgi:hypothetical protein
MAPVRAVVVAKRDKHAKAQADKDRFVRGRLNAL